MRTTPPTVRLMAKTNRAGYFHSEVKHTIVVHVDSSAESTGMLRSHKKACMSTGWVAHSYTESPKTKFQLLPGQPCSFGGSVGFMEPSESNAFELYGAIRTLRDIIPAVKKGDRKPVIFLMLDNKNTVRTINRYIGGGVRSQPFAGPHEHYWTEFAEQIQQARITAVWEKGHLPQNIANATADRIANRLRKSAECFGSLSPLQVRTDVFNVSRRKLTTTQIAPFKQKFFSEKATATSAHVDNGVLISIHKTVFNNNKGLQWSVFKGGVTVMSGHTPCADQSLTERTRIISDVILEYRTSEHFQPRSVVYLQGSALQNGADQLFFHFCNLASSIKESSIRYNLETIMTGMKFVCLLPDPQQDEAKHHEATANTSRISH